MCNYLELELSHMYIGQKWKSNIFSLPRINQMEREMCNYLEWGAWITYHLMLDKN